jgi:hypothetical protein
MSDEDIYLGRVIIDHQSISIPGALLSCRESLAVLPIAANDAHQMTWCCIQKPCTE